MHFLKRSSVEASVFALIGLIAVVADMTWWLRLVFDCFIVAIIFDLILHSRWTAKRTWPTKGFALVAGIILVGALTGSRIIEDYRGPKYPDVTLRLVETREPMITFHNSADVTARGVLWSVVVFNLDDPRVYSRPSNDPEMTDKQEPLPIPSRTIDFIKPHADGPRMALFGDMSIRPFVKLGQRFVGSATVSCPDCRRGRTFIVYVHLGTGGWYAELKEETSGNPIIPKFLTKENVLEYRDILLRHVPESDRIPIKEAD